jgi:hypothetical protein
MFLVPVPATLTYVLGAGLICGLIRHRRYGAAALLPIPILFASTAFGVAAFLLAGGLLLVALFAAAIRMKWYIFAGLAFAVLIDSGALHRRDLLPAIIEVDRLRSEFPVRSLKTRLAFHQQHPVPGGKEAAATYLANASTDRDEFRAWMLKRLHEESYKDFVTSAGFGFSRMPRVDRESIVLPVLARTPVASRDLCFDNRELPDRLKPPMRDLVNVHRNGLEDFLNSDRMGYARGVDYVVGFEPHAMAATPNVKSDAFETWQIARLELVSLLKHDMPVVYVSDDLPNLDELDRVPTRPLDEFEETNLSKLRDGEYLLTLEDSTVIRMLGAVRATESCLACHSVPTGTLLGAFSYEIRPLLDHAEQTGSEPLAGR